MKTIITYIIIFTQSIFSNWTIIDSTHLGEINNQVLHFYLDNDDNCWFAVGLSGVYKFNETSTIYYDTNNTKIPFMSIYGITQGPNGDMYFGNHTVTNQPHHKVSVMRFDGENWEYFDDFNSLMHSVAVWNILATGENEFWVATYIGLYHYKNGVWNSYFEDEIDIRRDIKNLAIDKNNRLYITNGSRELYSSNLSNQNVRFNRINMPQLLASSTLGLNIDSLDNLWLSYRDVYGKNNLVKRQSNNWITYDSTYFDMNTPWGILISKNKKTYTNTHNAVYEYKENTYWEKIFDIPEELSNENTTITLDNHSKRPRLVGVDSDGNFWLTPGINYGLLKYTPDHSSVAQKSNITLYPNPSQASITISAEQPITSLSLYSLTLSKIKDLSPNHTTTQEIDISTLPSGVYFIKVNDEMLKFVRE